MVVLSRLMTLLVLSWCVLLIEASILAPIAASCFPPVAELSSLASENKDSSISTRSTSPSFWFSSAHPCCATDCSIPAIAWTPSPSIPKDSQSSNSMSSPASRAHVVTRSAVTTGSKSSTKSFAGTIATSSRARTVNSVKTMPTFPAYSQPPAIFSGYAPPPSGRSSSISRHSSSSAKSNSVASSVSSLSSAPTTGVPVQPSSHCETINDKETCSLKASLGNVTAVATTWTTTTVFAFTTTRTMTVYVPCPNMSVWSSPNSVEQTTSTVSEPVYEQFSMTVRESSSGHSCSSTARSASVSTLTWDSDLATPSGSGSLLTPSISGPAFIPVPTVVSSAPSFGPTATASYVYSTTTTSLKEVNKSTTPSPQGRSGTSVPVHHSSPSVYHSPSNAHTDIPTPSTSGRRTPITKSVTAAATWTASSTPSNAGSNGSPLVLGLFLEIVVGVAASLALPSMVW